MSLEEVVGEREQARSAPEAEPLSVVQTMPEECQARVLIVIPCLNEAAHIGRLLHQLLRDPGAQNAIITVVDGGSGDRTCDIVEGFTERYDRVRLLHNPKRIQAAAVNLAVARFPSDWIIRVDAHASYPSDFCARLLEAQNETGADCVCVSMRASADTTDWFQIANATAQNSRLGTGGSAHRRGGKRVWVDHGHHALMRTVCFAGAGGYNETFSHNEDAELDLRLAQRGARILLAGDIVIDYHPRRRLRDLLRQYYSFGRGRARTTKLHNTSLRPRQLLPLIAPTALVLAAFSPLNSWLASPALAWVGLSVSYGIVLGLGERREAAMAAGVPAIFIHLAWALGFVSAFAFAAPDRRLTREINREPPEPPHREHG